MKTTNTASKNSRISKLFRSVLSFVMVLALLVSFGTMLVGCSKDDEEKDTGKPGASNKNNPAQYEGLEEEEYLQKLGSNYFGAAIESLGDALDAKAGSKVELSVNVGDDLLKMLTQQVLDGNSDMLDFLSKISLSVDAGMKNDVSKSQVVLGLNGKDILTLNVLMNMADSVMYLGAPDLNSTYLKFDIAEIMEQAAGEGAMVGATMSPMMLNALTEALPDADTLTTLLKRYVDIALAELDNVEQTTTTLKLDGLEQECTQLTLNIYAEDAYAVAKAVLKEAKNDNTLKNAIVDFADAIEELTGQDINTDEIKQNFTSSIEQLLESLEAQEKEDADDDTCIQLITYVDDNHNIIGNKLFVEGGAEEGVQEYAEASKEVEDAPIFYYYTVTEGDEFAFEAVSDGMDLKISGSGTVKNGKTNGTYDVFTDYDGMKMLTIEVEDMTADSGTLTIAPSSAIESQLGLNALPFEKLALELKYSEESIALNVLSNSKLLVGVTMKVTASNGPNLNIPSNAVDATDANKLQQWASNLNLNQLIKNLEKAGVPSELLSALSGISQPGISQSGPSFSIN